MKIAYLECFAGIAGDMFLGALVDVGVDQRLLQQTASSLNLGVVLDFAKVDRSGIQSTKARVTINGTDVDGGLPEAQSHAATVHSHSHFHEAGHSHRHDHSHEDSHLHEPAHTHPHVHGRSLTQIRRLIEDSAIAADAKQIALSTFQYLGEAEAKIHGVSIESIHFHEVGAVDAIVDIVCSAVGAQSLGVDAWYCSAVNTGTGFVDCAHGKFPVPAPATLELLAGVPVYAEGPAKELTTPTGAALLRALGCKFVRLPVMSAGATGYGAGTRNPEHFPNVLRLRIGKTVTQPRKDTDEVTILECAIDDATPEILASAAQQLLEHGALDVMQQSVLMKKGRQGTLLTVLCAPADSSLFQDLLFRETTTLGVRIRTERRIILQRTSHTVTTDYGDIHIKIGSREGEVLNAAPEFEDCRAAAQRHRVPLKQVMQAAVTAASGLKRDAAVPGGTR